MHVLIVTICFHINTNSFSLDIIDIYSFGLIVYKILVRRKNNLKYYELLKKFIKNSQMFNPNPFAISIDNFIQSFNLLLNDLQNKSYRNREIQ